MPRVPAHLCERALGMLQGGMRTADGAREINCNVHTVRRLRQCYRPDSWSSSQWQTTCNNTCTGAVHPNINTCWTGKGWQQQQQDGKRMATTTKLPMGTNPPTRQDWQKVLFTDELRFCLTRGDGRIRVYHHRNERYTEVSTLEQDRLSRPDHSKLFVLCVGLGVIGVFVFLRWPDMVPNQRQLFIVVSDWGSYLGSHFLTVCCGILLCVVNCEHSIVFTFRSFFIVFVRFN